MVNPIWRKLRKDEYVMNDSVYRISKQKKERIKKMDFSIMNDKRFA